MHFVSQDKPSIKAEGRLTGRRWKSEAASPHPSAPDELQHQQTVFPPPTPACHCCVPVRATAVMLLKFNALTFASHPQLTGQKDKHQLVSGSRAVLSFFRSSLLFLANNSANVTGYTFSLFPLTKARLP